MAADTLEYGVTARLCHRVSGADVGRRIGVLGGIGVPMRGGDAGLLIGTAFDRVG